MKRLTLPLFVICLSIFLNGCNSQSMTFSEKQKKAVDNCIVYIINSSFTVKESIDTSIIKIDKASNSTWKSVWSGNNPVEENAIDVSDWIITIGDTSEHNFAILVCDGETSEVIGHIPIE